MMTFMCRGCGYMADGYQWRIYRCRECNGIDVTMFDQYVTKHPICQADLKKILDYDHVSGILTWLVDYYSHNKGDIAGLLMADGYIMLTIGQWPYAAHRLAFLWMDGYLPENLIDHKDRVRSNNAWLNLREASHSCNTRNATISKNNKTGIKGVRQAGEKWHAHICKKYLGSFNDIHAAAIERYRAEVEYGFPDCEIYSTAKLFLDTHKQM